MARFATFILGLFLVSSSISWSQPDTLWTRDIGTYGNDNAFDVVANKYGFLVIGSTDARGAGSYDFFLVQTNIFGDTLWTRTYGGPGYDVGYGITEADDSSYVLLGTTNSFGHGNMDIYLVKVGPLGDTIWTRALGGSSVDWGYSISRNNDGGFIIAGKTSLPPDSSEQAYLVRTDDEGHLVWQRRFGGVNREEALRAKEVSTGGFIMVGSSDSYDPGPHRSVYVIRTSHEGAPFWISGYGGPSSDEGYDVVELEDENFLICGRTYSYGNGNWDAYFIRINSTGDTVWTRTRGGAEWDMMLSMAEAPDGGYVAAGFTFSFVNGAEDLYAVKIDPDGIFQWTLIVGDYSQDLANAIKLTSDNGYIIAGYTYRGNYQYYLVRLGPEYVGVFDSLSQSLPDDFRLLPNYPNPFNASTTLHYFLPYAAHINLRIFDINGRFVAPVADSPDEAGHHFVTWSASDLSSGVYFARLIVGDKTETLPLILLK